MIKISRLCGKCDLYDHVYMIGSRGATENMSKEEMFEVFKKRTNGTIYQNIPVKVSKFNIDFLIENNKWLERTDHNTYLYFGKEYKTLKQLDKAHMFYKREIHFHDMLDLIPYLPYIICVMSSDANSEYVEISNRSYIDQKYLEALEYGYDRTSSYEWDMKELKKEYITTIKELGY